MHSIPKEPRRVTACGFQTGLSVLMTPLINDYHTTVVGSYGFRVLIHDSFDYPDQNSESKVINSRLESFFSIAPGGYLQTSSVLNVSLTIISAFYVQFRGNLLHSRRGCIGSPGEGLLHTGRQEALCIPPVLVRQLHGRVSQPSGV